MNPDDPLAWLAKGDRDFILALSQDPSKEDVFEAIDAADFFRSFALSFLANSKT